MYLALKRAGIPAELHIYTGVGHGWSAYPILNLSLSAGEHHPAPRGPGPITFDVDHLRVYR